MPSTFATDPASILWNATAVSNAFLCEYMPVAPEGYVKVYLYGLMYAHGGSTGDDALLDDVAKALEMDPGEVEQALRYWERCRLVNRVQDSPPAYRFACVQQVMLMKQSAPQDKPYEDFARALNDIFGSRRQLHGSETVMAYEWVEQLKLPPDVVIMLVRHMITTRGVQFRFKEAQKVAAELCEQNIRTQEAAEGVLSRSEAAWKGARKILNRLGKRRDPSMDEIDLYTKWTGEWGYAPKAVEAACAETTKGDPSFAYLDRILKGIRERSGGKTTTAAQLQSQLTGERDESDKVRAMLAAFGSHAAVVDSGLRDLYRAMESLASEDVILLAAREVGKKRGDQHSIENVILMLEAWNERGIQTEAQATAYLKSVKAVDKKLRALFALAGREAVCSQANRELLRKWQDDWRLSDPVLELAASYSKNVDKPMAYMDTLLSGWRDKGVSTVAEAEEEHSRFIAAAAKERAPGRASGVKTVIEQQYAQRDYDPSEVNGPSAEDLEEASKL